jgi:hypothetical protein
MIRPLLKLSYWPDLSLVLYLFPIPTLAQYFQGSAPFPDSFCEDEFLPSNVDVEKLGFLRDKRAHDLVEELSQTKTQQEVLEVKKKNGMLVQELAETKIQLDKLQKNLEDNGRRAGQDKDPGEGIAKMTHKTKVDKIKNLKVHVLKC